MSYTFRELQKCAERELAMRKNVFSKHGMTVKRQAEIGMMEAIVAHFKKLADEELKR
jgi:hypothetical protein